MKTVLAAALFLTPLPASALTINALGTFPTRTTDQTIQPDSLTFGQSFTAPLGDEVRLDELTIYVRLASPATITWTLRDMAGEVFQLQDIPLGVTDYPEPTTDAFLTGYVGVSAHPHLGLAPGEVYFSQWTISAPNSIVAMSALVGDHVYTGGSFYVPSEDGWASTDRDAAFTATFSALDVPEEANTLALLGVGLVCLVPLARRVRR